MCKGESRDNQRQKSDHLSWHVTIVIKRDYAWQREKRKSYELARTSMRERRKVAIHVSLVYARQLPTTRDKSLECVTKRGNSCQREMSNVIFERSTETSSKERLWNLKMREKMLENVKVCDETASVSDERK